MKKILGEEGDLLPGLPNDLVLTDVVPRIPWYHRPLLTILSHSWASALRDPVSFSSRTRLLSPPFEAPLLLHRPLGSLAMVISIFDFAAGIWRALPPIPGGFPLTGGILSTDGKVFVLGGMRQQGSQEPTPDVRILDIASGLWQWQVGSPMHAARSYHYYVASGGKIFALPGIVSSEEGAERYVGHGQDRWKRLPSLPLFDQILEAYDIQQDRWDVLPGLPLPIMCEFYACRALDLYGHVLYCGEEHPDELDLLPSRMSFIYDPSANKWLAEEFEWAEEFELGSDPPLYTIFCNQFCKVEEQDPLLYWYSSGSWKSNGWKLPMDASITNKITVFSLESLENDTHWCMYALVCSWREVGENSCRHASHFSLWRGTVEKGLQSKLDWQNIVLPDSLEFSGVKIYN